MTDISSREFGALEERVRHLNERIASLEKTIDRLDAAIETLTSLLDQARGARWMFAAIIGVPSFAAGILAALKVLRP